MYVPFHLQAPDQRIPEKMHRAMNLYGITYDDIKEKNISEFGTSDEKMELKEFRKNFREKKRWNYIKKLRDYMEDRVEKRSNIPELSLIHQQYFNPSVFWSSQRNTARFWSKLSI